MIEQTDPRISICNDQTFPLNRPTDGRALYLHCLGGFRGAQMGEDAWIVEPVLDQGQPCGKGFFTKAKLREFIKSIRLTPIAFQSVSWVGGRYHSTWNPLIPNRRKHLRGPADLWSSIASNLARQRTDQRLRNVVGLTREEIAKLLDDRTDEERLARSISLSLRSMDICVEQIAEFYNEQLSDLMAEGFTDGRRSARAVDQVLFAHVHSFFLHLGAARDYLAALIAARIGQDPNKTDSMARLIAGLRLTRISQDPLLTLLHARNFVRGDPANSNRLEISGWLREASELRNQFVHRRPYGARHVERFGFIEAIAPEIGLYRYRRPVMLENDAERDILEVVASHYAQTTALFQEAAEASGGDISMIELTDTEIISIASHSV